MPLIVLQYFVDHKTCSEPFAICLFETGVLNRASQIKLIDDVNGLVTRPFYVAMFFCELHISHATKATMFCIVSFWFGYWF